MAGGERVVIVSGCSAGGNGSWGINQCFPREGRKAWIVRVDEGEVEAIWIYAIQNDQVINNDSEYLSGISLKLCTFKVGEKMRGKKIGELFLKAAFRFATDNRCENIFIHASPDQIYLLELLNDFGFQPRGTYGTDIMLVKSHPRSPPVTNLSALEYVRLYFPHYRNDSTVQKFLVPIKPPYHQILFPELSIQGQLFAGNSTAGNAIKQAYLCKAPTTKVRPGDVVLFYRTLDVMAVTTIGVVEYYDIQNDPLEIMQLVRRRTVYSQRDIQKMVETPIKVMLFRLLGHLSNPVKYDSLILKNIVSGPIQSITKISDDSFATILSLAHS